MIARKEDQGPEELAVLNEVVRKFETDQRFQRPFTDKWNRLYGLAHNWERMKKRMTTERGRDTGDFAREAKREFGDDLQIPVAFAAVETAVPQALANNPRMLPVAPGKGDDVQAAVKSVQQLFDRDQSRIAYEIKLQSTFKRGEWFGIGVQKTYWRHEEKSKRYNEPRTFLPGYKGAEKKIVTFDGPMAESVDPFDFFWDPNGIDIDTCAHVIHRTWRTWDYVVQQVKSGVWRQDLDLEELQKLSPPNAKGQVWKERMTSAGLWDDSTASDAFQRLHEVWEYHTGTKVCTILDGQILVQEDINPAYHNEIPFQIFRPHLKPGEFVGTGMLEPIEPLINELGQLRGQRRDAATVALNPPAFYQEDMLDPDDFAFGPNVLVGTQISPQDALFFPRLPDVPNSGYQEATEIKNDIDGTTGISDVVMGGPSDAASTATATGAQLTVAAATRRIQQHTKNCEVELIRPAARQWLEYYKQKILRQTPFTVADPSSPTGFSEQTINPEQLALIEDILPDGGSTQADNEQQKQTAATGLHNLLANVQGIDQQKLNEHTIRAYNVPDPESWIVQKGPADLLQEAAQMLIAQGADQNAVLAGMQSLLAAASGQPQAQGPQPEQTPQSNGGPAAAPVQQ